MSCCMEIILIYDISMFCLYYCISWYFYLLHVCSLPLAVSFLSCSLEFIAHMKYIFAATVFLFIGYLLLYAFITDPKLDTNGYNSLFFFSFPSSICFNAFFPLILIPSTRYFRVQMFSIFHMMMYVIFVSLVIFLLCSPIYIPCSITETHNICIWLHNFVFRNHFFYVLPLLLRLCRGMFLCVLFSIRTNVIDGGAVFYSKLFAFVPFKV